MKLLPIYENMLKRMAWRLNAISGIEPITWSTGIQQCQELIVHGIATTIGKFSKDGDNPEQIVCEYCQCSNYMKAHGTDRSFYLSLKPPAIQFDTRRVMHITEVALKNGHGIHFDSHGHHLAEPTLDMLKFVLDYFGTADKRTGKWQFGLTLPARWKRSLYDAQWAVENGVRVRIVKGEFKADRSSDEMEPGREFLRLVDSLSGSVPEIAIATHDLKLADTAVTQARKNGTEVELELLFGMPASELIALTRARDVPLRLYVPYGDTLLLYLVKHLLANPHKLMRPHLLEVFGGYQVKLSKICHS